MTLWHPSFESSHWTDPDGVSRPYASILVHLVRRNRDTGKCGGWESPIEEIQTMCRVDWTIETHPRRTFRIEMTTCEVCLAHITGDTGGYRLDMIAYHFNADPAEARTMVYPPKEGLPYPGIVLL